MTNQTNKKPARKVIHRGPTHPVGTVTTDKENGVGVQWESKLERQCIQALTLCVDVENIQTQPLAIEYLINGITKKAFPDIQILASGKKTLIEVKPTEKLLKEKTLEKQLALSIAIREAGFDYHFMTDEIFENKTFSRNISLMRRYRNGTLTREDILLITNIAQTENTISLTELSSKSNLSLSHCYTALAQQHICCDLLKEIDNQTIISIPNNPYKPLTLDELLNQDRNANLLEKISLGIRPDCEQIVETKKDSGLVWDLHPISGFIGRIRHIKDENSLNRSEKRYRNAYDRPTNGIGSKNWGIIKQGENE